MGQEPVSWDLGTELGVATGLWYRAQSHHPFPQRLRSHQSTLDLSPSD